MSDIVERLHQDCDFCAMCVECQQLMVGAGDEILGLRAKIKRLQTQLELYDDGTARGQANQTLWMRALESTPAGNRSGIR